MNILDFSKIEEGRKIFDFEMVDMSMLLAGRLYQTVQDQVRHKHSRNSVEN